MHSEGSNGAAGELPIAVVEEAAVVGVCDAGVSALVVRGVVGGAQGAGGVTAAGRGGKERNKQAVN